MKQKLGTLDFAQFGSYSEGRTRDGSVDSSESEAREMSIRLQGERTEAAASGIELRNIVFVEVEVDATGEPGSDIVLSLQGESDEHLKVSRRDNVLRISSTPAARFFRSFRWLSGEKKKRSLLFIRCPQGTDLLLRHRGVCKVIAHGALGELRGAHGGFGDVEVERASAVRLKMHDIGKLLVGRVEGEVDLRMKSFGAAHFSSVKLSTCRIEHSDIGRLDIDAGSIEHLDLNHTGFGRCRIEAKVSLASVKSDGIGDVDLPRVRLFENFQRSGFGQVWTRTFVNETSSVGAGR